MDAPARNPDGCRRCLSGYGGLAAWLAAMLAAALAGGCRLPGSEGPVSRSLLTSRQLSQRGQSALERGQWDAAHDLLAEAVESCPVDVDARRLYAEALRQLGRSAEAIAQLDHALRLSPDDVPLLVRAGQMRLDAGDLEFARRASNRAIDLDPRHEGAWALRGEVHRRDGDLAQALADFQRALACAPGRRELLLEVAELYRALNRPAPALAALQQLRDTYATGEEPRVVLHLEGLACLALERYNEAAAALELARDRGPPEAEILAALARAHWLADRPHLARQALDEALAADPHHGPSRQLEQLIVAAAAPGQLVR